MGVDTTEEKINPEGEVTGERKLTLEELKEAIRDQVSDDLIFILPEAKRLPAGIRYWLQDLMADGLKLCLFAVTNPSRDIFLETLEIELSPPSDRDIRERMRQEAEQLGIQVSENRLAKLQPLAGQNLALARKVLKAESLGLNPENPEHKQYLDISPIVISGIMALSIVRFIGMGTGNRGLYIVGGCALIIGMMLKQLGRVRGSRRRLGQ